MTHGHSDRGHSDRGSLTVTVVTVTVGSLTDRGSLTATVTTFEQALLPPPTRLCFHLGWFVCSFFDWSVSG